MMREQVEELQKQIEEGVAGLVDGEDWRAWLQVAARSPRYSFRNTLLIRRQCPDASVVMGYRAGQAPPTSSTNPFTGLRGRRTGHPRTAAEPSPPIGAPSGPSQLS